MCAVAVQTTDGQIAVRNASFGEGRFGFLNDIENGRDAFIGHVGAHPEIHFLRTGILAVALCHAKIEDRQGWQSLPQWMDACDVVTVARGDLGSNLGLLHLPAAQKDMAARCRRAGKPFLVVTQLLHTMTEHPTPTRAEVLDVYNAVLDGASALMLTGETARGRYPLEAVRWLLDIARQAEEDQK